VFLRPFSFCFGYRFVSNLSLLYQFPSGADYAGERQKSVYNRLGHLSLCFTNGKKIRLNLYLAANYITALQIRKIQCFNKIFCENWQNPVKQRITPHFLTTSPSNYYEFTTKE
ncbi:hypothetical protein LIR37_20735, partial [Flavonifractor plautii]